MARPVLQWLPAALFGFSFFSLACIHPAEFYPPPAIPDPRSYTWTIDTIAMPGSTATLMRSIWGSSGRDVYIAGHNDRYTGTMFHFDGALWRPVGLTVPEGGSIQGNIDIAQVVGFTSVDVFAVGGRTPSGAPQGTPPAALAIHYDGLSWTEMPVPSGSMLRGFWGLYKDEMWAVGDSGTVLHASGPNWVPVPVPGAGSLNSVGGISSDDVYALSSRPDAAVRDASFRSLWQWNGGVWAVVDSFHQAAGQNDKFGTRSVWSLLAVTYTCGQGVFRLDGSVWDPVIPGTGTGTGYLNAIYGTANNSLFVVGDGAVAYHVNPANALKYPAITGPSVNYYGVWTDGEQAFIVGNDGQKTYVLHGQ